MTVISALLAGAEWIDDTDVLRAGGSEIACGHDVRAPSTIGVWLRAFTWGHVRQLEAAGGDVLARAWNAGGGPTRDEAVTIDLDSTFCETYGLGKQGAWKVNRDGLRGYHPLVSVINGYDQVAATRRILEGAGFTEVTFEGLTRPMRIGNDVDDALSFIRSIPFVRNLLTAAPPDKQTAAVNAVRAALGPYAGADGVVTHNNGAWLVTARR